MGDACDPRRAPDLPVGPQMSVGPPAQAAHRHGHVPLLGHRGVDQTGPGCRPGRLPIAPRDPPAAAQSGVRRPRRRRARDAGRLVHGHLRDRSGGGRRGHRRPARDRRARLAAGCCRARQDRRPHRGRAGGRRRLRRPRHPPGCQDRVRRPWGPDPHVRRDPRARGPGAAGRARRASIWASIG